MEKFKTLNNSAAKLIILNALDKEYHFCAYSLYNHYMCMTFSEDVFRSLALYVKDFLGDSFTLMFTDDSIDWCVRDMVNRIYHGILN